MLDRWVIDWPKTGKGARIALVILALFCFLVSTFATLDDIQKHHYITAFAEFIFLGIFLIGYAIWPYRIAWAAYRRGGNFNFWFVLSVLLNPLFVGIYYLLRWSRKPMIVGAS